MQDRFDDLKQFIISTNAQLEGRVLARIDGLENHFIEMAQSLRRLEQKVDDGFSGIGDVIEEINDRLDGRVANSG